MIAYPNFNPVAFYLGNWPVYWYGLMYLIGFAGGWLILFVRAHYIPCPLTKSQLADLVFYTALGAVFGGRIGYMLFYALPNFLANPILLFKTWEGGMSFHGGLLGVIFAIALYARYLNQPFLRLTDLVAPAIPFGLAAGRIGNFINGELWGRVSDMPWAMIFPHADLYPRHPSQLYEFGLEGIVLLLILNIYGRKLRPLGANSAMFLIGYGVLRIGAEFFREPDIQIGYLWGGITEGQLLSLPLVIFGSWLLWKVSSNRAAQHENLS